MTEKDIDEFEKKYRFSEEEEKDVLNAYIKFKGCLSKIMDAIMLSTEDDETRFSKMIERAIDQEKV